MRASGSSESSDWQAQLTEWAALGYHGLRSTLFFAESLPLVWLQRPDVVRQRAGATGDETQSDDDQRRRRSRPRARLRASSSRPCSLACARSSSTTRARSPGA